LQFGYCWEGGAALWSRAMNEVDPITVEVIERHLRDLRWVTVQNNWFLGIIAIATVAIAVKVWFFP